MDNPDKPGGQDLIFTDNDVWQVRDKLYQTGLSRDKVKTLIDSHAIQTSIDAAFDQLDNVRENENTVVIITFSGHGGQVPDTPSYDETDECDEFIAAHDTSMLDGNLISDDELDAWLSRLESEQVVVVIDSCYNAGLTDPTENE